MARKQYDEHFRKQVVLEVLRVGDAALIAEKYNVSRSTVHSWVTKYQSKVLAEIISQNDRTEERQLIELNCRLTKLLEQSAEEKQRLQEENKPSKGWEMLLAVLAGLLRLLLSVFKVKI